MAFEGMNIYKPVIAVENIEISGTTTTSSTGVRVTCIECCGSRMFIGTAEGFLIEYFITDDKDSSGFRKIRHTDLNNKNQSVQYIRSASAIDSLLILSGNFLSLIDISSLEIKGNSGIRNVNTIGVDDNPVSSDPFAVQFCFSRKTSIQLGRASEKGFNLQREINVDSVPLSLSIEGGLICAALASGYYIMLNSNDKQIKPIQLCMFDTRDKPQAVHVKKDEFLVVGPGGLGVFVTKDGSSERPPISWPDKVSQIVVHNQLYILGMGQDVIYIHSLVDYVTCHTISFRGLLKCLSLSEGNLYTVSGRSLFKLNPVSTHDQIQNLLANDEIEKALNLLQLSHLKFHEHQQLEQKIHAKAVFIHLKKLDFQSTTESIRTSGIDLREILSLFPNILPSNSTFTRSLPSLHNFVNIKDMTNKNVESEKEIGAFLACFLLDSKEILQSSKDLCTGLFKLVPKYLTGEDFKTLIKEVNQLPIDFENLLDWLQSEKYYNSAALIHININEVRKALDLWFGILEGKLKSEDEEDFDGFSIIIQTLVDVSDPGIVWLYFEKLILIDPNSAVEIFTRRPISYAYPPLSVAEKLRKWPNTCITYLEDCINAKDVQDEDCHTYLAVLYIEVINGKGEPELKDKLRQFLMDSNCLKLQFLIGRLQNTNLRHELAILHGKAGDHRPALLVFTNELNDHKMAREYCTKLKRKEERKEAFLILLKIYLESQSEANNVIDLLQLFGEEFDLSFVLPLLPDDWSIELVSSVLFRAVRNSLHEKRQGKLLAGLSQRVSIDYQIRAFESNQGYNLDSDSVCEVCHKGFDLTDPIFCKSGYVVHEKCK